MSAIAVMTFAQGVHQVPDAKGLDRSCRSY